jgi:ABC-2 type transport system ATP-binding protein
LASVEDGFTTIRTTSPTRTLYEILGWAIGKGLELDELTVSRPSLEDVYLRLVAEPAPETATTEAAS